MKNEVAELDFCSSTREGSSFDTLSFSWTMELQEADKIRLKAKSGTFLCQGGRGCTFNGKFIRQI